MIFSAFPNCSEEILSVRFQKCFLLVLAHLGPELELLEVDDTGDDGVNDL